MTRSDIPRDRPQAGPPQAGSPEAARRPRTSSGPRPAPARPIARALAASLALALCFTGPARAESDPARDLHLGAHPGGILLAGLLPIDRTARSEWAWSGAWLFPVGDPYRLESAGPGGEPGFKLSRGVTSDSAGRHDGADLVNGRPGDPVRAAAHGIVIRTATHSPGYGALVVLGHRLEDGTLAYSVYSHLDPSSIAVRRGARVHAGQRIGRVGRSGRATTDHLHFEVRLPRDPVTRWERAPIVDPIAFVERRLPAATSDTTWARPYLEWAQCAALVSRDAPAHAPLTHAAWWSLLARAARHSMDPFPDGPAALHEALRAEGVVATEGRPDPARSLGWTDMERDVKRLKAHGLRLAPCPVVEEEHRRLIAERLGSSPGRAEPLGSGRAPAPTLADVLLAVADLVASAEDAP